LRTPAQNLRTAELLPWFCAMVAECPRRGVRMGRALASGHPPCGCPTSAMAAVVQCPLE